MSLARVLAWIGLLVASLAGFGRRAPARGTAPAAPAPVPAPRQGGVGGDTDGRDRAPGDHREPFGAGLRVYVVGLALALVLTGVSFYVASGSSFVWRQGVPIALIVLAVAQIGVHLVFFLHVTTGPDNTNNVMALAFGVLIVLLVLAGTLWIMANLNHNMMPMHDMLRMQR